MQKLRQTLRDNFWPVSAIIFCPCHLPLTMGAVVSLTAGTAVGAFITAHYTSIESVLAVTFSFYFVLAFMIWVVRGPNKPEQACAITPGQRKQLAGLSTQQIVVWGVIGMFTMPALVSISIFTENGIANAPILSSIVANMDYNSGLIWLLSIATVVMIPVMVVWLVWLWLAWAKTDMSKADPDQWGYEYE